MYIAFALIEFLIIYLAYYTNSIYIYLLLKYLQNLCHYAAYS